MKVPVCEPHLGDWEVELVSAAVRSGWISGYKGQYIDDFERKFAEYCGCKYGITTTSCATALLLTLESLGIGKGDEVITTTFTMIATVSAIIHAGAKPVLVDVDPETWNIDVTKIEEKITKKTKAIMPVPIYGHPVDIIRINEIAEKYGLVVIEDAAEAIGAQYYDKPVGAFSDASCFSFYINKMITTGEGGMIVTNDRELADIARKLKGYDTDPDNRFIHEKLGFNYRMTNIQAAIGCAQMCKIDKLVNRKREIAFMYLWNLGYVDKIQIPVEMDWAINCYWVFGILVEPGIDRNGFIEMLKDNEIETRSFFTPMHMQPALIKRGLFKDESYPIAEDISKRGLYLPNGTTLKDSQVEYVCECIEEALK